MTSTGRPGLRAWLGNSLGMAAAPVLLCVVAAVQITRVICCDQCPWLGGGFGMFATPDSRHARFVKVYLLTKDCEIPADDPWLLETAVARTAPTADNLERVADELDALTWVHDAQRPCATVASGGQDSPTAGPPIDYRAIRVELWRTTFDAQTHQLHAAKMRETVRDR